MTSIALGAHVGQQNMSMDELRATWRRLDDARVDWISVWDHLYEAPPEGGTVDHFEAIATLGALCAETTHARIGCLVFYVGYRNPGIIAKAATTLDHISGGRFELGLGAGWHAPEAKAFGYDFPRDGKRLDMLEEAAPLIRRLLDPNEDRTTHRGEWFETVDASCLPAPVQDRLPIWIGGVGEKRTLPIVAAHADGWNAAYVAPDEFQRLNGVLDSACEKIGRDPREIKRVINLTFNLGADEAAATAARDRLEEQWGSKGLARVLGGGLNGTPDQAIERIHEYQAAGATGVNVALRAPWDAEALDAYLDHVIPAVRAT
ncbi:MAG: LLM class flavin-dependent oxidoreductase [Acidimicrobiales bacterium]|nr:LLM class flavin-dependent oxidoreductase [Acidimicrobiales bacterium]